MTAAISRFRVKYRHVLRHLEWLNATSDEPVGIIEARLDLLRVLGARFRIREDQNWILVTVGEDDEIAVWRDDVDPQPDALAVLQGIALEERVAHTLLGGRLN